MRSRRGTFETMKRGRNPSPAPGAGNVRIEMREGFPAIVGGAPRNKDDIVKAIKADREARLRRLSRK